MSSAPLSPSPRHDSPSTIRLSSRRWFYVGISTCVAIMGSLSVSKIRSELLSSNYLPHLYCYFGRPGLIWSHVTADTVIGVSYLSISITLAYLVHRGRRVIPFHSVFLAFGLFIVACGFSHLVEALTVWVPVYVLSAAVKIFTALASLTTALVLPFLIPQILLVVRKATESDQYLRFLETSVVERDLAQQELRKANEFLEWRVRERTLELASANEELKESEQQYRLLFDSNPMPMWVYDRDTLKFLAVNEAAVRHYGYSLSEFFSMTIADIRPSEDIPRLLESVGLRLPGLSAPERWRHRIKDRTIIQVDITSHAVNMNGKNAALILAHDVTEQTKSQELLRQSEERFATAFRSNPVPTTITTEENGLIVDANDAYIRMTGYSREELIGKNTHDLSTWAEYDDYSEWLRELKNSGRTNAFETRLKTKSGKERLVQISAERIVLGGEQCVLANAVDITESRHLEDQLRQAQKMEAVGQLAGGVAHDFNNLLSVMMGYSEMALNLIPADSPVNKHIDQIKRAGERASTLTRQLLAFSRKQVLELRILNLNSVVHNVHRILLRVIGEDISLILKPGEPLGSVKADLGQMEQVLMNLAVNARDAMPDGGKIIIETADAELDEAYAKQHATVRPGLYVMLSFSDTGHGMDAATMSRIFEPFFTTKGPGKGTGLGLSTVYGIVKQSGGYVWAYSEPGQGTTFKVYLPRVDSRPEILDVAAPDSVSAHGNETILLVEDDTSLRELASEMLRSAGYSVMEAKGGNEAIEITKQHGDSIDMVLTDVIMPGMSGADLSVYLLSLRPKLIILFMSGYAGDLVARAGIPEPERFVLQKPFTRNSLLTKVRSVLDGVTINPERNEPR